VPGGVQPGNPGGIRPGTLPANDGIRTGNWNQNYGYGYNNPYGAKTRYPYHYPGYGYPGHGHYYPFYNYPGNYFNYGYHYPFYKPGYYYPWGSIALAIGLGLAARPFAYWGGGWGGYYGGGYYGGYGDVYASSAFTPSYGSVIAESATAYVPPAPIVDAPAQLTVILPAPDAKLWIDDYQSTQTGLERSLITPALTPGQPYSYTLLALWIENGQPVSRARLVQFQAGESVVVDFTAP
jgi:uncharacterized protein (TIGR03000 family)